MGFMCLILRRSCNAIHFFLGLREPDVEKKQKEPETVRNTRKVSHGSQECPPKFVNKSNRRGPMPLE